jgi:hypothetical protein
MLTPKDRPAETDSAWRLPLSLRGVERNSAKWQAAFGAERSWGAAQTRTLSEQLPMRGCTRQYRQ